MLSLRVYGFCCIFLVGIFLVVPGVSFADRENVNNVLITPDHPGFAEGTAVPGLHDATPDTGGQRDALINVIKGWVNWGLGVLGLIALVLVLYGGFLMVTAAGNEEKHNKGWIILRHVAIGIVVIGVARFIVSGIFWLVNVATDGVLPAGTNT